MTVTRDPTGTHFLLFAHPDEVFRRVAEWVAGGGAGEDAPPPA